MIVEIARLRAELAAERERANKAVAEHFKLQKAYNAIEAEHDLLREALVKSRSVVWDAVDALVEIELETEIHVAENARISLGKAIHAIDAVLEETAL